MTNLEELNKKIAEWLGFKKASSAWVEGIWKHPFDGTGHGLVDQSYQPLPDFTTSLDACKEYIFPKLTETVLKDDRLLVKPTFSASIVYKERDYFSFGKTLALAFCKAVEKLLVDNETLA